MWSYNRTSGLWTCWQLDAAGGYGSIGVPSTTIIPPTRIDFCTWDDSRGNLWLFGGWNQVSRIYYNDMWMYNSTDYTWTWFGGTSQPSNEIGPYYQQLGVSAFNNTPGHRQAAPTWIDSEGLLWLFSGYFQMNDLWNYNVVTNEWTCVHDPGSPVFGTKNVSDSANLPPSRRFGANWIANNGTCLYVFGGMHGGTNCMCLFCF
jgi:hypothetical protein